MSARILVIEDNAANLDLMTYLLSAFGYSPLLAEDGEAGLEVARHERLDLIICDVQLPTMDGYEVARWLKSHPHFHSIPLIAVTALAMVGDRDKLLAAGFDGYISKPISPETFVHEVARFLNEEQSLRLPSPSSPSRQPPPAQERIGTILVVDNLPVHIELARSILTPFGYAVLGATGMEEALALAYSAKPDLILSDVNMASSSGYDFITAIKADPQLGAIPFVFITSTALSDSDRARGLSLGAARFLLRPIDPDVFLSELQACLREGQQE